VVRIEFREKPISCNHMYGQTKGGRRFLSKDGKDFKSKLSTVAQGIMGTNPPFEGLFIVNIHYYFQDKRRRDVTNYDKPILDSLSKIVYKDDTYIKKIIMEKDLDKEDPRIIITIEEYGNAKED